MWKVSVQKIIAVMQFSSIHEMYSFNIEELTINDMGVH